MSETTIFVRKPDGTFAGELDTYTSLTAIDRHLDAGSWSLVAPSTDLSELLATPSYGISIWIDGEEFLAGPTTVIEDDWTTDAGTVSTISGLSDKSRLWEYECWPCAWPFTASAYDHQTGLSEAVIKHYVSYNLGDVTRKPAATAAVGIAPNLGRGSTVTLDARFETVGDNVTTLATITGLGFQIKELTFDVFVPQDRSADIVFDRDTGNLVNFKLKRTRPTVNRAIGGGSGDLTARLFDIQSDDASAALWGAYIETFVDQRGTSDPTQLAQAVANALSKGAEQNVLTLQTIDLPNRTYRTDWNLGDVVTAQGIQGTINQVQLTVNDKGQIIQPNVNSAGNIAAASLLRAYDELRAIRRRLAYLERSV